MVSVVDRLHQYQRFIVNHSAKLALIPLAVIVTDTVFDFEFFVTTRKKDSIGDYVGEVSQACHEKFGLWPRVEVCRDFSVANEVWDIKFRVQESDY